MTTELYRSMIAYWEDKGDQSQLDLQHRVWDGAPWMVSAFTGCIADDRDMEMRDWCRNMFGDEAWPIHGKPGSWKRGGATIDGWTWYGFETEEMMRRFQEAWPGPDSKSQERNAA